MNTSRLSYASSPESDLEMSTGPTNSLSMGNLPQLVKASSDPSIATNQENLERDVELNNLGDGLMPPPYTVRNLDAFKWLCATTLLHSAALAAFCFFFLLKMCIACRRLIDIVCLQFYRIHMIIICVAQQSTTNSILAAQKN